MPTRLERRKHRSANYADALVLLLESIRERANLRSVALSDRTGILVAGAGPAGECDELAAWAPLLTSDDARAEGPFGVKVQGLDAYLCAAGGDSHALSALSEAAEGCARILGVRALETLG